MSSIFENLPINLDDLPKVEDIDFQPIDKKYLKVILIGNFLFFLLLAAGLFALNFFTDELGTTSYLISGGAFLLVITWNLIITFLGFKRKMYAIRDKDIIYTKGLIWFVRTSIPFNRIQHAEIKQGPIERKFKLSSLKVFTAGGQSSDLVIPGLPSETAQQLKDFILRKTAEDGEPTP